MALPNDVNNLGVKNQVHTTTFYGGSESFAKRGTGSGFISVGYINPDGRQIPEEYLIKITSIRNKCTIIAPIQEQLEMLVESKWEPFVPSSLLKEGNILLQALTGSKRSLITKASSRRIWVGSSPMTISINMKFNAVVDPFSEVAEPCRLLQSIALPSDPSGGEGLDVASSLSGVEDWDISKVWKSISNGPLLLPPGPSPFTLDGILNLRSMAGSNKTIDDIEKHLNGGDIIVVEIGRFLMFYNVIVQSAKPTVQPMFDPDGFPVSASVSMVFETYEMMTTEELSKSYNVYVG
jgi:hypothetical protein